MSRGWLLDTNVVSELRKARREPRVVAWVNAQPPATLFQSLVTIAEIRFGIESLARGERREALAAWLRDDVRRTFDGRIVDVGEAVLVAWRRGNTAGRRAGRTPGEADTLIAATAAVHDLGVATRNVADFAAAGVPLVNPWDVA